MRHNQSQMRMTILSPKRYSHCNILKIRNQPIFFNFNLNNLTLISNTIHFIHRIAISLTFYYIQNLKRGIQKHPRYEGVK